MHLIHNKTTAYMQFGSLFAFVFCCLYSLIVTPQASSDAQIRYAKPVEVRAVWMDRRSIPKTEQAIRMTIRRYADAGFNLIFPEVIYNGYTAYTSKVLPMQNLWNSLDVLKIIVEEAHRNKMEVHPWVWVFRAGYPADKGGIITAHPDWVAVGKDGKAAGFNGSYWLCPSIPEARELLMSAYKELVSNYKVDGIHLDYIRFDDQSEVSTCYNKSCRDKFTLQYGIDPCAIEPFTKSVMDWHLWREELVNSFVHRVSDELRKIRPNLKISAAVGDPCDSARINLLQNWMNWADNRWIDFLVPMDYTSNNDSFERRTYLDLAAAGNRTLIIPGIGVHLLHDNSQTADQIEISRYIAAGGNTLFASSYIKSGLLDDLKSNVFAKPSALPFRDPSKKADRMFASAVMKIRPSMKTDDAVYAFFDLLSANSLYQYADWMKTEREYISPTPPKIFIPDVLQPIPEVSALKIDQPIIIDGQFDDQWQKAVPVMISTTNMGESISKPTDVRIAYDQFALYICMTVEKPQPDEHQPTALHHDEPVFNDDSFEVFIDPAGNGSDYLHFALNTIGAKFDQKVFNTKWDCDWNSAVIKNDDVWRAEIAIPFKSLGVSPPAVGDIWRANFCRNRYLGVIEENSCWSATYGSYNTPIRFGRILF